MEHFTTILKLAFPLILSSLSLSILQFIDRTFLSWFSTNAVAAAMPSGALHFAISSIFFGSCTYVGTFISQYFGAKEFSKIGPMLWQGVWFSFFGSLAFLLCLPLAPWFFSLFDHSQEIQKMEIDYFQILCFGLLPMNLGAVANSYFGGLGRTWPGLWSNLLMMVVNIVLCYWFVFGGFGLEASGVVGAAWSTVISQTIGALFLIVWIFIESKKDIFNIRKNCKLQVNLMKQFLYFGLPAGFHLFLDVIGFTVFMLFIGNLGAIEMAASNIAFQITILNFMPTVGIGIAVSILVGQSIGNANISQAQKFTKAGVILSMLYTGFFAVLFLVIPHVFILPFSLGNTDPQFPEIAASITILLRFLALFAIYDGIQIILSSALKGAGDTHFVMKFLGFASLFGVILPCYVLIEYLEWGLYQMWAWLSFYIFLLFLGYTWRYKKGAWHKIKVISPDKIL